MIIHVSAIQIYGLSYIHLRFSYHFAGISSGTSSVLEGTQKWDVQNRRLLPGKDVSRGRILALLFDFYSIVCGSRIIIIVTVRSKSSVSSLG